MSVSKWYPSENMKCKKYYGKSVNIYYNHNIDSLPLKGIFVDLYDTHHTMDPTMHLTIKLYTPEKTSYGLITKFTHIRNDEIYKIIVDDSNYLHNKYLYCRSVLISILPEEIVKKHIFSFIQYNFIEM